MRQSCLRKHDRTWPVYSYRYRETVLTCQLRRQSTSRPVIAWRHYEPTLGSMHDDRVPTLPADYLGVIVLEGEGKVEADFTSPRESMTYTSAEPQRDSEWRRRQRARKNHISAFIFLHHSYPLLRQPLHAFHPPIPPQPALQQHPPNPSTTDRIRIALPSDAAACFYAHDPIPWSSVLDRRYQKDVVSRQQIG
jgi:hypothetical protein